MKETSTSIESPLIGSGSQEEADLRVKNLLEMGTSRVVKKDQLDIVLEDARDRDVAWPGNFHIGIEVATCTDLARIHADMRDAGVPMETDVFAHARGSRFFCWMPGRLMLEVNTREDAAPEFRRTFASQQG